MKAFLTVAACCDLGNVALLAQAVKKYYEGYTPIVYVLDEEKIGSFKACEVRSAKSLFSDDFHNIVLLIAKMRWKPL